jgi:hypothetical protein
MLALIEQCGPGRGAESLRGLWRACVVGIMERQPESPRRTQFRFSKGAILQNEAVFVRGRFRLF